MKKLMLILLQMLTCITVQAQFSANNSFMRKEIVSYTRDWKGYFVKHTNMMVDVVSGVLEQYAYDKKTQNLYVLTRNSNVVVTLTKDYAKIIKKNKVIPQLTGDILNKEIEKRNAMLEERFSLLNHEREQEINDSIVNARNKIKQDSIDAVNRRNAFIASEKKAREDYKKTHEWYVIPFGDDKMKCELCDEVIDTKDIISTYGFSNDTIYYMTEVEGDLDLSYKEAHKSEITPALLESKNFQYHYEVFEDKLTCDSVNYDALTDLLWLSQYESYLKGLRKKAPFGYIKNWGWDDEYSMVTFHIEYANTNSRTIKYLTVYFKITNDVGDIRTVGYFKGTGPVKKDTSASWDWDTSPYYTSGDASNMEITKVVITYMNGTQQVVTGKFLQFN